MLPEDYCFISERDLFAFFIDADAWDACFCWFGDELSAYGFGGVTCFWATGFDWGGLLIKGFENLFPFFWAASISALCFAFNASFILYSFHIFLTLL